MPVFDSKKLLAELENDVKQLLATVANLELRKEIDWNKQPQAGKWSAIQIIEHLNSYNRFYLPAIGVALNYSKANHVNYKSVFKAGMLGNYFTNMMKPGKDGKIGNKMNAPQDHMPASQLAVDKVLTEFITEQNKLIGYLKEASNTDIGKLKVPISISKFIKLKLGDTFRFLIAHQQRHFIQLNRTLV